MRLSFIFTLLLTIPALYILAEDLIRYQENPAQGLHLSSVGEVWINHDRNRFETFKAKYRENPQQWNKEIRPYLEKNAFAIAATPAMVMYLVLIICWLLGVGPFREWDPSAGRAKGTVDGLMRGSASKRGRMFKYNRR